MQLRLFPLAFLLLPISSLSQIKSLEVDSGKKTIVSNSVLFLSGTDQQGDYYFLQSQYKVKALGDGIFDSKNAVYSIHCVNKLELSGSQILDNNINGQHLLGVFCIDNLLHSFYAKENSGGIVLSDQRLNNKTLTPEGTQERLATIPGITSFDEHSFYCGPDRSGLAFYYTAAKNKNTSVFYYRYFNRFLDSLSGGEIILPFAFNTFSIQQVVFGKKEMPVLLLRVYDKVKNLENIEESSSFYIVSVSSLKECGVVPLNLPNARVASAAVHTDSNGIITIAGFYTDNEANRSRGTFFLTLDSIDGKVPDKFLLREFNEQFVLDNLASAFRDRERNEINKGKKPSLYFFEPDNLFQLDGGSFILVGRHYIRTNGQFSHKIYSGILVFQFNEEGQKLSSERINYYYEKTLFDIDDRTRKTPMSIYSGISSDELYGGAAFHFRVFPAKDHLDVLCYASKENQMRAKQFLTLFSFSPEGTSSSILNAANSDLTINPALTDNYNGYYLSIAESPSHQASGPNNYSKNVLFCKMAITGK